MTHPDLNKYLVAIFVNPTVDHEIQLRASAGLMLKNNILKYYDIVASDPSVIEYIKHNILLGIAQPVALIRNITGSTVSALISQAGFRTWPDVLPELMNMASHDNPTIQEGSLSALAKLFEDSGSELESDPEGQRVLGFMIPRFLELARSPAAKVRIQSIICLNQFILRMSQALFVHIDIFLTTLFQLAVDPDPDVRRNICTAFVMLLDVREDKLVPHLNGIVDYTLHCMGDDDEQVALEACEFLLGLAEHDQLQSQVVTFLPKILPVLLKCMVYSEQDILHFESLDSDDADMADKLTDIKPMHAKSKTAHTASGDSNHNNNDNFNDDKKSKQDFNDDNNNNDDEDDEDDEDEDEDFGLDLSDWNLRKCSAAALDIFASSYHENILQYSIPILKQNLVSHEWPVRESAILGYGAIAVGCVDGMSPFLPEVIPFLIQALDDPVVPIRQIACWTLGRFSSWICYRSADIGYEREFIPVLTGLLKCCLDNNKKVQEAGCSGFATFTEQAGGLLIPYLIHILRSLSLCFQKYQAKNLAILYDAVQTLVDKVGYAMKGKEFIDLLLPPLIDRWQKLADDDTDLFPLLECLSSVTAALGDDFAPFAQPVFLRGMKILTVNVEQWQRSLQDSTIDSPDKDFIVTALDLIDGLIQGLGPLSTSLIQSSDAPLMPLLITCTEDPVPEVRQSAFALLGDMAISTFDTVKPFIPVVMSKLIPQIFGEDPTLSAVCNNATWAAGELALRLGHDVQPWVEPLMDRIAVLFSMAKVLEKTILENAAITIGRIGISCPELIAPKLQAFAAEWCKALRMIRDTDEKQSAFKGMSQIVMANPSGLQDCLPDFIEAIGLYTDPTPELGQMFSAILNGYRALIPDWSNVVMARISPDVQMILKDRYNV
ncbi:armadillo-type protein [Lipomyces oligophaga]|uniref:armadillo-type protein n=1 Tax=Lipomyces oligophaga TaxID=45792 RepID=UPI0034CE28FB